jgi:hypothetical protein
MVVRCLAGRWRNTACKLKPWASAYCAAVVRFFFFRARSCVTSRQPSRLATPPRMAPASSPVLDLENRHTLHVGEIGRNERSTVGQRVCGDGRVEVLDPSSSISTPTLSSLMIANFRVSYRGV